MQIGSLSLENWLSEARMQWSSVERSVTDLTNRPCALLVALGYKLGPDDSCIQ